MSLLKDLFDNRPSSRVHNQVKAAVTGARQELARLEKAEKETKDSINRQTKALARIQQDKDSLIAQLKSLEKI